ncbi:hypothetical protein [Microtetraspora sp. NBRC 16547]|uniref:hypothetical protein n=1 Tax=Microtetraspora sp. NBRC 16547 TaxID=3030993 RepID=UPI0024A34C60|nr:hypothetical protein [Microtetraspora sp. NBRC 16547]GLX03042.1 hypothetical protein Misp02_71280 [Microtetraspora sp. NBRC 16547]
MTSATPETVSFEGRHYELVPSTGEVICSKGGYALHHLGDCQHLRGGDQSTWRTYPDPDRLTWRRLLDSAPSTDKQGRREFAQKAGLLNGLGSPVTHVCDSCLLKPLSTDGSLPLAEAVAVFDRASVEDGVAKARAEIGQVQRDFPREAWPTMPLERYALGVADYKNTF